MSQAPSSYGQATPSYNPNASGHQQGGGVQREKLMALPVRNYLDETVVPIMMQALAAVSRERPEDPVDYVAHYMLKNNPKRVADARAAAASSMYGPPPS